MTRILVIACAVVALAACARREDKTVTPMKLDTRIPPIDAAAPATVETATFALG